MNAANLSLVAICRYTSPRLAAAAVHGVMALKGTAKEFGIVTTPILHYCVKCRNDNSYGTPTEEGNCCQASFACSKPRDQYMLL